MGADANVDPDEQAFYGRLASQWWNSDGPFWPLHKLNEIRTGYIVDTLAGRNGAPAGGDLPLRGLSMLDIGCGGGILSESMARYGADVHGIDVVERNIAVARLHADESKLDIDYELIAPEALAARGAGYDVVLNMEVVEHVPDVPSFMAACASLVRPGGLMFVATLNRNLLSFVTAIVGAEYILGWLPRGTHQWRRFQKPAEIASLLDRHGIAETRRNGVSVNPLTRRFSITGRTPVNYMLVGEKRGPTDS
ncbi:MAG: bifunctional 2-polyprenyl-6-hydroxyphenol methylase/3-demethylubiquinol 3-O-methyltransferase UbiG [Gammaproteobacteria bacterium]|nr:bifunctional 2-polyprenyl-6-hydroxyphenol methylase/3-demethylubiquinol 3-O-methyltransferase UbiG [Gammaproteobacteria bacterium]